MEIYCCKFPILTGYNSMLPSVDWKVKDAGFNSYNKNLTTNGKNIA